MSTIDKRAASLFAIAAVCVVMSGCGGEHSRGLSRHQLIRRAQAICLRAQSAVGAMLPPSRAAGPAGTARYLEGSAAIAQAKTSKLRALRVRAPIAARWHRVIRAEEAFTARMHSLGQAAASGDVRRLEAAEANTRPEQALIRSVAKLGVTLCAP